MRLDHHSTSEHHKAKVRTQIRARQIAYVTVRKNNLTISPDGTTEQWLSFSVFCPSSDLLIRFSTGARCLPSVLSLRMGLVSHFLRVLTGLRVPSESDCEPGLELSKDWWGAEGVILPSLPVTEYDSEKEKKKKEDKENDFLKAQIIMVYSLRSDAADIFQPKTTELSELNIDQAKI